MSGNGFSETAADAEVEGAVLEELQIAQNGMHVASSSAYQRLIEQKEKELRDSILQNYEKIRGVERELSNLQLQLKLNVGPKKHALELLRKKIEAQNEKVVNVRKKYTAAKQVYESLEAELKREEEAKDQLCVELNTLVQQSADAQLNKLEELKNYLEVLGRGVGPGQAAAVAAVAASAESFQQHANAVGASASSSSQPLAQGGQQQQQQQLPNSAGASSTPGVDAASSSTATGQGSISAEEAEAVARREAAQRRAAEAARSRHVQLPGQQPRGPDASARDAATSSSTRAVAAPKQPQQQAPLATGSGAARFAGFDT